MAPVKNPHFGALLWSLRMLAAVLASAALLAAAPAVRAHGGVYLEDDLCVIKVGFYQAHFTIFQPTVSGHEQFCEDVPTAAESVFVLEYLHDGLSDLPIDFRIIENTTNMGLFATWQDVQALPDLEQVTVFYHPPVREPDVFAVLHRFIDPGQFIGIVTSVHPETEALYTAVFPFEVGYAGVNYLAVGIGIVAVALILWVGTLLRGLWRNRAITAALLALAFTVSPVDTLAAEPELTATGTYFRVEVRPTLNPLRINRMHQWEIKLTDREGNPVDGAVIGIAGGMPAHDHGLPTSPAAIEAKPGGVFLVGGVKFHMRGDWEMIFTIEADGVSESIKLPFKI